MNDIESYITWMTSILKLDYQSFCICCENEGIINQIRCSRQGNRPNKYHPYSMTIVVLQNTL